MSPERIAAYLNIISRLAAELSRDLTNSIEKDKP